MEVKVAARAASFVDLVAALRPPLGWGGSAILPPTKHLSRGLGGAPANWDYK